jgi:hypothetical protein
MECGEFAANWLECGAEWDGETGIFTVIFPVYSPEKREMTLFCAN